jgi:hypothetical protein
MMLQEDERPARTDAEELVGELWAAEPPDILGVSYPRAAASIVGVPGREPRVAAGLRPAVRPELLGALVRVSTQAELRAISAPPERPALALLAATARSLHRLLAEAPAGSSGHGQTRVGDTHLRVARMERWLTERAEREPAARAAADVALWVLEQMERRSG